MLRLPRLRATDGIVNGDGRPASTYQQWWESVVRAIEQAFGDIIDVNDVQTGLIAQLAEAVDAIEAAAAAVIVAQDTGDDAMALAATKVTKNVGPVYQSATGTGSRATFAVYTAPTAAAVYDPAQFQAVMNHVQTLSQHFKALLDDLRANGALTP